jgi:hypothetical protein
MNKKIYLNFVLFLAMFFLLNCSNSYNLKKEDSKKGAIQSIPKWYLSTKQEDKKWMYEVATSISPDLELGQRKTILLAKSKLADRINGVLQDKTTLSLIEIGKNNNLSISSESKIEIINVVSSTIMENYLVERTEILRTKGGSYRFYIQIKVLKKNIE